MSPKVSVIIPVYGVERYIGQCARSLFDQTLDDIEYLFVNDCTPDRSIDVLKDVLKEYPSRAGQVRIIDMPVNSGQAAVRVRGIMEATGEYVIHCDSDDWIGSTMYELLYSKAVEDDADCVICNSLFVKESGSKLVVEKKNGNLLNALFNKEITSVLWNKLYRRSLLSVQELVVPAGNIGEDSFINIQYAYKAKKVSYIDDALYYYRINEASIIHSKGRRMAICKFNECIKNVKSWERWLEINGQAGQYRAQFLKIVSWNRDWLIPYLWDGECYDLWLNTFPGLNKEILHCSGISFGFKCKIVLGYLRIPYKKPLIAIGDSAFFTSLRERKRKKGSSC